MKPNYLTRVFHVDEFKEMTKIERELPRINVGKSDFHEGEKLKKELDSPCLNLRFLTYPPTQRLVSSMLKQARRARPFAELQKDETSYADRLVAKGY